MSTEELVLENSNITEDIDLENTNLFIENCSLQIREILGDNSEVNITNSSLETSNFLLKDIKGKWKGCFLKFSPSSDLPAWEIENSKLTLENCTIFFSYFDDFLCALKVVSSKLKLFSCKIICENIPLLNFSLIDTVESSVKLEDIVLFAPVPLTLRWKLINSLVDLYEFHVKSPEHIEMGKVNSLNGTIEGSLYLNNKRVTLHREGAQEITGDNLSYFNDIYTPITSNYVYVNTSAAPALLELSPVDEEIFIENPFAGAIYLKMNDKKHKTHRKHLKLKYTDNKWTRL